MAEPIWTTIISAAVPAGLALLTVSLTRERSGGEDHAKLTNCVKDSETVKNTIVQHATTLATHTLLHEQSVDKLCALEDRVRLVERWQDQAVGREQRGNKSHP